ncbi:MAG: ComF family protein [Chitinophagaceae bacterium]|nr:ComF family protein [Anaerolineae bacterium]
MPSQHLSESEARLSSGLLASKIQLSLIAQAALDLLFPPQCAGCDRVDSIWCSRCHTQLVSTGVIAPKKAVTETFMVASTGLHDGILQQAVQGLKYQHVRLLSGELGHRLSAALELLGWTIDVIVPVPLGEKRLKERGYNQAQLIAERLAAEMAVPCLPYALRRRRETQSQVGLNAQQRSENMVDAFEADAAQLKGLRVLIVDDVLTTGSTLNACAQAALAAGVHSTWGLTVTAARIEPDTNRLSSLSQP